MRTFNIEVRGKTESDVIYALEEVKRKIERGFLSGLDSNDDGDFDFDSEGDYEEVEEEQ